MLSKSDYNKFLQCVRYLWLSKFRKDLAEEYSEQQQAIFSQGYEVEDYAHLLFPGVESTKDLFESAKETVNLIAEKTPVIYQATAVADWTAVKPNGNSNETSAAPTGLRHQNQILARTDILVYDKNSDSYDIYEVKSTTETKLEHLPDIAFQKLTFQKAGYPIGKTFLIHLNNEYVRNGEIEPKKLLTIEDLTESIDEIIPEVETGIPQALDALKQKDEPDVRIVKQCYNPYTCPFINHCWSEAKIPEYSVYDLTRIREDQLVALLDKKKLLIKDIPFGFKLTKSQEAQVKAEKTGRPIIRKNEIEETLNGLEYPLYFLDYETVGPAVPLWDGTKPYQQVCFQYSLHVVGATAPLGVTATPRGAAHPFPAHHEFLSDGQQNPMPALLKQLKEDFANYTDPENIKGTVIVWNKSFEMTRNDEMAAMFPDYSKFLKSLNDSVFDLMNIFRKRYYVHKDFHGSCSIKKVLPVLVPELSYENLEIGEGGLASLKWLQANFPKPVPQGADEAHFPTADKAQIHKALLTYCGQDTLAMVKILDAIR